MSSVRLTDAQKDILAELYGKTKHTRDSLPYTEEFEQLHAESICRIGRPLTQRQVWKALANLGKASRLTRKQR